jgi:hypothetical protein
MNFIKRLWLDITISYILFKVRRQIYKLNKEIVRRNAEAEKKFTA